MSGKQNTGGAKCKRYKVQCSLCNDIFDCDYVKKHTVSKHPELQKQSRLAPVILPGELKRKNPWTACSSKSKRTDFCADFCDSSRSSVESENVNIDNDENYDGDTDDCDDDYVDDDMELENILGTKTDVNFTNATNNACISIPSGPEDISRSRNCKPVQPILERFPKHKDGDRFRSFNSKLYHFKWLEYSVSQDSVFCYYCRHFSENGSISDYKCDTFIVTGYRQWKKCYGKSEKENRLLKHQLSFSHCKAVANYEAYNSTLEKGSVISQISKEHTMLIKENRHYLVTLCEILLTIAQQKIGVRESGSLFRASAIDIESESIDYGPHSGNFLSLLALVGNHDEVIARRIRHGPGNAKYTHHSVQNALLDIMADEVKNKIFEEMQAAEYFAILADETKDLSKKEQLSIAVRYLYDGNIHEEFLCIEELETLDAEGLSSKIINVMKDRVNFQNCIGQAYDGASVVSGKHAGVNAIIKDRVAPLANYIHCFNHRLNLVLVDVATSIQCVRDCLSLLQKLYVFVSCSNIHTKWIKMQTDRGLIVMELKQISNTRWACQASMLRTVCKRFMLLYELLSDVIENDSNSDRVIEARGLLYQFSPDFIKTLFALRHIFEFTKNTSDLLQSPELDYSDALELLEVLQERLNDCRTDTTMQNLWSQAANVCHDLGMHDLEESCDMQRETERRPQRAKQFPSYLKNFIVDCPVQREKLQNRGDFRRYVIYIFP